MTEWRFPVSGPPTTDHRFPVSILTVSTVSTGFQKPGVYDARAAGAVEVANAKSLDQARIAGVVENFPRAAVMAYLESGRTESFHQWRVSDHRLTDHRERRFQAWIALGSGSSGSSPQSSALRRSHRFESVVQSCGS